MPWSPELFSAPVLEQFYRRNRAESRAAAPLPYFAGVQSGETHALVRSFAGEPELHHPTRGRVKGGHAFERFVAGTNAWLTAHNAVVGPVARIITPRRTIEETVLALDVAQGRGELPVAIAADRDDNGRIVELRVYYSLWPLTGRHAGRLPLLPEDLDLRLPDIVGDYQQALAAGDVGAAVAVFEPDAYVREPAGGAYRGRDELAGLFAPLFAHGCIPLEHCAVTDDGRSCALEYNVVRWNQTELPAEAGLAVCDRGSTGKLASVRMYDDVDRPLSSR
jgi:hypothetical protein